MSTTSTNPIVINGTVLQLPNDRAVSITTSSGIRIELQAKPEDMKVVGEPASPAKKRKPHEVRPRHLVHEDRLRLARAVARAGDRGITLIELRDRLGLAAEQADTAYNDLTSLRRAGLIALKPGLTTQTSRYFAITRGVEQ